MGGVAGDPGKGAEEGLPADQFGLPYPLTLPGAEEPGVVAAPGVAVEGVAEGLEEGALPKAELDPGEGLAEPGADEGAELELPIPPIPVEGVVGVLPEAEPSPVEGLDPVGVPAGVAVEAPPAGPPSDPPTGRLAAPPMGPPADPA